MITCEQDITINVVSTPNVQAYWKLDEAGTNIERFDSIKNLSLSPLGGTSAPTAGVINNGVQISGVGGKLFGDIFNGGTGASWSNLPYPAINGASISVWIKWSGANPNFFTFPGVTLTFQDAGGIATGGFSIHGDGSIAAPPRIIVDFLKAFSAVDQTLTPGDVVLNVWNNIVATYNQTTHVGTVYLNGALVGVAGLATWTVRTNAGLALNNAGGYFTMNNDEVGIWNDHVLTQSEVTGLFNSGSGSRPPNVP